MKHLFLLLNLLSFAFRPAKAFIPINVCSIKRGIILFACFFVFTASNAQTHKKGLIAGETWTKPNSPYIIDSAIFVASLTIEPGVEVRFAGNYVFEVGGILTAVGSDSDSIRFRRDSSLPWQGIRFQQSIPGSEMAWCVITNANNTGITISNSFPIIRNCAIRNNMSSAFGGGLNILNSTTDTTVLRIKNCSIQNNRVVKYNGFTYGGGVSVQGNVEFILCLVKGNLAYAESSQFFLNSGSEGGGVYVVDGTVKFFNSIISNNRAEGYKSFYGLYGHANGGGVAIEKGNISFSNTIVADNVAIGSDATQGGGVFINSISTLISNSTFANNNPHAIYNNVDTVNVVNSIIYFNNNAGTQVTGKLKIRNSDVQNGYTGTGNINFHPLFMGAMDCEYKIVAPSLCIDAGVDSLQYRDACIPPSLGSIRNDMGAHGGPDACRWNESTLCPAVPVTWLYFKAQPSGADVKLTWATAQEQNTKEFIIERSFNARDYASLGTIRAAGNSNRTTTYQYLDKEILSSNNKVIFYRLKQVDLDGKYEYSTVVRISLREINGAIVKVSPNPFTNSITLQLPDGLSGKRGDYVQLLSREGRQMYQRQLTNSSTFVLDDLPKLPSGMYVLKAVVGGQVFTSKVIRQ